MKKEQLLNWISRLVELKREFDKSEGDSEGKTQLARILGYIESGEFILKHEKVIPTSTDHSKKSGV